MGVSCCWISHVYYRIGSCELKYHKGCNGEPCKEFEDGIALTPSSSPRRGEECLHSEYID